MSSHNCLIEAVDDMARDELLHSSTLDSWDGKAFRKSRYTVWDDEGPSAECICSHLEANADEFEGEPDPQRIVPAVREKL